MPPPMTRTSKVRPVSASGSRCIADFRFQIADFRLQISGCRFQAADFRLQILLQICDVIRNPQSEVCNCYSSCVATIDQVREYWEQHIHDLEITQHPVGSRGFFDDLDQYHFEKLHHLLRLVDFNGYRGRSVLEVGCGAGVDLARFAKGGAEVTGVDLAASAIDLARASFEQQGLKGLLQVADGECLPFPDNSFDLVYAHGVVQYT